MPSSGYNETKLDSLVITGHKELSEMVHRVMNEPMRMRKECIVNLPRGEKDATVQRADDVNWRRRRPLGSLESDNVLHQMKKQSESGVGTSATKEGLEVRIAKLPPFIDIGLPDHSSWIELRKKADQEAFVKWKETVSLSTVPKHVVPELAIPTPPPPSTSRFPAILPPRLQLAFDMRSRSSSHPASPVNPHASNVVVAKPIPGQNLSILELSRGFGNEDDFDGLVGSWKGELRVDSNGRLANGSSGTAGGVIDDDFDCSDAKEVKQLGEDVDKVASDGKGFVRPTFAFPPRSICDLSRTPPTSSLSVAAIPFIFPAPQTFQATSTTLQPLDFPYIHSETQSFAPVQLKALLLSSSLSLPCAFPSPPFARSAAMILSATLPSIRDGENCLEARRSSSYSALKNQQSWRYEFENAAANEVSSFVDDDEGAVEEEDSFEEEHEDEREMEEAERAVRGREKTTQNGVELAILQSLVRIEERMEERQEKEDQSMRNITYEIMSSSQLQHQQSNAVICQNLESLRSSFASLVHSRATEISSTSDQALASARRIATLEAELLSANERTTLGLLAQDQLQNHLDRSLTSVSSMESTILSLLDAERSFSDASQASVALAIEQERRIGELQAGSESLEVANRRCRDMGVRIAAMEEERRIERNELGITRGEILSLEKRIQYQDSVILDLQSNNAIVTLALTKTRLQLSSERPDSPFAHHLQHAMLTKMHDTDSIVELKLPGSIRSPLSPQNQDRRPLPSTPSAPLVRRPLRSIVMSNNVYPTPPTSAVDRRHSPADSPLISPSRGKVSIFGGTPSTPVSLRKLAV